MLFKKKRHLLNSHILHLTFSLIGTLDSGRETSSIPHKAAFENLLCDLEVNIMFLNSHKLLVPAILYNLCSEACLLLLALQDLVAARLGTCLLS